MRRTSGTIPRASPSGYRNGLSPNQFGLGRLERLDEGIDEGVQGVLEHTADPADVEVGQFHVFGRQFLPLPSQVFRRL